MVRPFDRDENLVDMVEQPPATSLGEVQVRACIEHNPAAVRVADLPFAVHLFASYSSPETGGRRAAVVTENVDDFSVIASDCGLPAAASSAGRST